MLPDLVTPTLLEWVNTFPLATTVRSIDELSDGVILWEILQDIDPTYFLGDLPEPSAKGDQWVPKWQNLKSLHRLLISYVRQQAESGEAPPGMNTAPDLKAIAETGSTRETNELLRMFLIAAITSPNGESYITTMQKLETSTQEALRDVISELYNPSQTRLDQIHDEPLDHTKRDVQMDPELQFEERVGKVLADNDKLKHEKHELEKELDELHDRLARLQQSNDSLQDRLTSTEDRLTTLKSGKGDLTPNAKVLENKNRQQEDLIASQEAKLAAAQDEIDSLRMSVESLHGKNQRFQKLQDDYDEIKNERDQLSRKANAAEKYRQKLQASQDFEKEAISLRTKVNDLQQQLKDTDSSQTVSSEKDKELNEYRRILERIEQECHEIQGLKKQLEFDNHALRERLETAEEQHSRDQDTISELRDRLEGADSPTTPGSSTPKAQATFHGDLAEVGKRESRLKFENDELKKEIEKFKSASPNSTVRTAPSLQDLLQNAYQEYPSLDTQNANPQATDGSQAGPASAESLDNETYRKLHGEFTDTRRKLADAEGRIEITERQLADAKTDLGVVGKDKLDIINEVKETSNSELIKMREDWDALQQKVRDLEAKLDLSQTVVREVSSERDSLRDVLSKKETEFEGEDKAVLSEMKRLLDKLAGNTDASDNTELSSAELLKQFAETTERSAENLAKRAEHINQQNEVIKSLQERVKHYEELSVDQETHEAMKAKENELMKEIQRQAREIALISSAWYELQSRLQNANAAMPRYRHPASSATEAQYGWLGKQRAIVAGASTSGGRR